MDCVPTSVIKTCAETFSMLIARLAALSFKEGKFPAKFKQASVTPLLKKEGLNDEMFANYRPISNLNTMSKIIERLFMSRLVDHVKKSPSYNRLQSAYRQGHSTETALLKVLNDVYTAADNGYRTALIQLDLSAAFDTIDINTLLRRLRYAFGISGPALNWIASYTNDRKQSVRVGQQQSPNTTLEHGVPQGSVLGPLLFTLYMSSVAHVINSFGVDHAQYADDTQLYIRLKNDNAQSNLTSCITAVHHWLDLNGLAMNPDKTEAIVIGTGARQRAEPRIDVIDIGAVTVQTAHSVKSLGVTIDDTLSFNQHIDNVCRSSYFHLRALRHIRQWISNDTAKSIACATVAGRLDYCNSLLLGVSVANIHKLQRVQNSLARIVVGSKRCCHITPVLAELHWLPIQYRIQYKLALITFKVLTTRQPHYLYELIRLHNPVRQLRSSGLTLLKNDRAKLHFADRAFCHAAPTIWNSLPQSVIGDLSVSVATFKSCLKTELYGRAFC